MDLIYPKDDPLFAMQSASYSGTAGSTTGWQAGPKAVLVWATTDACFKVGDSVTATIASAPIPANTPVMMRVPPGAGPWRVSAIQISAGGTVYAKPCEE